jgi:hypothetical protein
MRGDSATRLRSNAAPHHTLYFLIEFIIISTPTVAETLSTPPIEAATDAITVTLAPKLKLQETPFSITFGPNGKPQARRKN